MQPIRSSSTRESAHLPRQPPLIASRRIATKYGMIEINKKSKMRNEIVAIFVPFVQFLIVSCQEVLSCTGHECLSLKLNSGAVS